MQRLRPDDEVQPVAELGAVHGRQCHPPLVVELALVATEEHALDLPFHLLVPSAACAADLGTGSAPSPLCPLDGP